MSHSDLVIIGAGQAAAAVIDGLRGAGDERSVLLIGNEGERPYERPGLSKEVLLGDAQSDSVYIHDQAYYDTHGVQTRLDDAATGIDPASSTVTLASGETATYTDLVLATGATPRRLPIPGMDLPGVHTLRRIPDSQAIKATFGQGRRIVIIGGGWIGLEVAAAARQAGSEVTVLEAAGLPLENTLGQRLGRHFADLHTSHGATLRTGSAVAIEGATHATGVRVDDETLPADAVVVAVGAAPNLDLAEAAGLPVDGGVKVDEHLRAAEHIYAVGDIANAHNTTLGHRLRVEHWDNAARQGQLAGRVLAGGSDVYDWHPYFFTDQYDLGMEYVGRGAPEDDVVIRGDMSAGEFLAFWLRDGVLTAGMNVNIWDVNDQIRGLLGTTVDPARLADADIPLTEV